MLKPKEIKKLQIGSYSWKRYREVRKKLKKVFEKDLNIKLNK